MLGPHTPQSSLVLRAVSVVSVCSTATREWLIFSQRNRQDQPGGLVVGEAPPPHPWPRENTATCLSNSSSTYSMLSSCESPHFCKSIFHSFSSLSLSHLLHDSDVIPNHQQSLNVLRDSLAFGRYVLTSALHQIHQVLYHLVIPLWLNNSHSLNFIYYTRACYILHC